MRLLYLLFAGIVLTLPLYGQGGMTDSLEAAEALRQGDLCIASEDYRAARACYGQAIPWYLRTGRRYEQAYLYLWLSEASYYLHDMEQAMKEAKASLRLAETHLNTDTLAFYSTILQNIGLFYSRLGDFDEQMRYYQRSLRAALACRGRESPQASDAYFSVGAAYGRRGHWGQFISYTDTALQIAEAIGYKEGIASALLNLSYGFAEKEDFDKAIRYQQQALALTVSRTERARGLNNLGSLYIDTGEYDKALEMLAQALSMRERDRGPNYFSTLLNIARALSEAGQVEQAGQRLDEVIEGLLQDAEQDTTILQIAYNYKARLLVLSGRAAAAEPFILNAIALHGKRPDVNASSFLVMGEMYLAQRRYEEALAAAQQGLQYQSPGFIPENMLETPSWKAIESVSMGRALFGLKGDILREWGLSSGQSAMLRASLETFYQGDSLVTWSRNSYQNRASRDLLAANANELYAGALKTLFHLYQDSGDTVYFNLALAYIEKNKALSVLENLNALYARSFYDIPDAYVMAEQLLEEDIEFYLSLLKQARDEEEKEQAARWEREVFKKQRSQDSLMRAIRQQYPRYYSMKHGYQLVAPSRLRKGLLADGETLVEYFIDGDSVFVLLLSARQARFFHLPAPALAERVAELRDAAIRRSERFYTLSYGLYRMLVEPLEGYFAGGKLAIAPDGVLAYLPFELLLSHPPPSVAAIRQASMPYLLRQYSIRYLLSANTALQPSFPSEKRRSAPKILAVAPVFGAGQEAKAGGFSSLPGAQAELDSLESSFPGWYFRAGEATEANFKQYSQYADIYHIATHAEANDLLPGASRLVLNAGAGEDGELFAYELYKLHLPAGLAVLSACDTGIGKIKKGEGSASLAHAFAYAGCSNLVMSLWPVRDRATPVLMKRFYDNLAAGMEKAEALRAAKLYCLEWDELFAHPYFWSGFLYVGDRETMPLEQRDNRKACFLAGLALGLFLLAVIVFLKRSGLIRRSAHRRPSAL